MKKPKIIQAEDESVVEGSFEENFNGKPCNKEITIKENEEDGIEECHINYKALSPKKNVFSISPKRWEEIFGNNDTSDTNDTNKKRTKTISKRRR